MDLSTLVNRGYSIVRNIVSQLAALYQSGSSSSPLAIYSASFKNVHLQTVFESLGNLFTTLLTLDEAIVQNTALATAWGRYIRMAKNIKGDPARYGQAEDNLWQLEKLLFSLKGQLLDGLIFQNCIEQEFDFPGLVEVKTNKAFKTEFFANIKGIFSGLAARIGETSENNQRDRFPGLCGLYAFYMSLFKDPSDKTFFKSFWELQKKIPLVNLYANVSWFPGDFIQRLLPSMSKLLSRSEADLVAQRREQLKMLDKDFAAQVRHFYLQVSKWMVRMESNLTNRADIWEIMNTRTSLLTQGLVFANHVSLLFKTMVGLHVHLAAPLRPSDVRALCQCCELLKGIENTFHRRSAVIGENVSLMMQQISVFLQQGLLPVKTRLEGSRNFSDTQLDVLAAVRLAMTMLNGPATPERRLLLRLALHVVFQMNWLKDQDIDSLKGALRRLELIADLQDSVREATDCSSLFWSREMIPAYFTWLYQHPTHAPNLQYIVAAMHDVIPVFRKAVHVDHKELEKSLGKEIEEALLSNIVQPLCRDIETDLRLHIHSHLEVSVRDPFRTGVKDLTRFVSLPPVRIFGKCLDIRTHITHYLDTTFYNLNTVALYDWKTYGEMRNLATHKYGLHLAEVHLPGQTLEQGLDVLEIMRNIHIFVARYNYNLNNQIFVERSSESKTLNTINIGHIANSIRTHGTGIMNTTVNFTYQFLRQKFNIFSQFLFDDHIKSRLYKDIKFYKESRESLGNMYPFERAVKFNKDIRKLGVTDAGMSFLDQFRVLITHIGNAMGYIRLVRSGGLHYISNAIKFVPDLQNISKFEELVTKEGLSPETTTASKNLDTAIDSLAKNFAEGTEYFKMLVQVFAEQFRNPANQHLRNFYVIVPPLMLNYIEHILLAKDKLVKKTKHYGSAQEPILFTDDGFAIGVAYILKLLDQNKDFDTLHWFNAVSKWHADEEKSVNISNTKRSKEDQQTTQLTIKKLRAHQMEFDLFRYSFSGARIFFKD
eukprot:TRINITY_DN2468_c0_g1_i2.p1 TRINITY_DN2468_c0_g1~~TRINITY_DN2468_c0_g1_i2.p1  ORF type:complete len:1156 (+),score=429.18 TRINITY_DN2468_c0_g1_i2:487-3468(+)